VSENTVAALMREQNLVAQAPSAGARPPPRPGRGRWAGSGPGQAAIPGGQAEQKWYGYGTEIPTGEGKLYPSLR